MNLQEKRATALKSAHEILEKAQAENRDLSPDEVTASQDFAAEIKSLNEQIDAATKSKEIVNLIGSLGDANPEAKHANDSREAKSLGEHFIKTAGDGFKRALGRSGASVSAPEWKAAGDTHAVSDVYGPLVTDVSRQLVSAPRRELTIADLLGVGTLTGNAVTYFVEGAIEGGFKSVAEGKKKPQLHFADPVKVTENLHKLAGFIKITDEMSEDLAFIVSEINNRLLYELALEEENQLLNGAGGGSDLTGLLKRTGIQNHAGTAPAQELIFQAMTKIKVDARKTADAIVINPLDYEALRLSRDGNGQYFGGGFFEGQYGNGEGLSDPALWKLRTVVTPAIDKGTALVGAFKNSATLYRKGGVRVESTNSHADDFVTNLITIRAEERIALACQYPAGFVKVDISKSAPTPAP